MFMTVLVSARFGDRHLFNCVDASGVEMIPHLLQKLQFKITRMSRAAVFRFDLKLIFEVVEPRKLVIAKVIRLLFYVRNASTSTFM
jgi:hypothetical protein